MKSKTTALLLLLFSTALLKAQDPCSFAINKSKGLPSNAVYDMMQDAKGYVWITHDAGLTRYDAFQFKNYTSALQTSQSGSDLHEDNEGRIWYQNFDGYLYFVQNDSMHALAQHKPVGYQRFGIVGQSVFAMQANGVDMYNLKSGSRLREIKLPIGQLSYTAQIPSHYYVLCGNLYQINETGRVKKIKIPVELLKQKTRMFNFKSNLFILSENAGLKTFYTIKGDEIIKVFEVGIEPIVQNISIAGNLIWACTTHGAFAVDGAGKLLNEGKAFFASKNITCAMQDREKNYWFGTANEGVVLVPDLNTRLISLGNYKPNKVVVAGNSLFVGTKNDQLLGFSLQNAAIKCLANNAANHEINQLFFDEAKQRIFYTSQEFNLAAADGKKVASRQIAVKQICKIDALNYAFAASGTVGLFRVDKSTGQNEWDSVFTAFTQQKGSITLSQVQMGVRGKSVVFNPSNKTVYFATNTGLLAVNPNGVKEIETTMKNLFISKLSAYKSKVFALSTKGVIYEIDAANRLKELGWIDNLPREAIKSIKVIGDLLFIFTNNELGFVSLNLANPGYQKIDPSFYADEINDVEVWKNELILVSGNGLILGEMANHTPDKTPPLFDVLSFRISDKMYELNQMPSVSHRENEVEILYALLGYKMSKAASLFYSINNETPRPCDPETRSLKLPALAPGVYNIAFSFAGSETVLKVLTFTINKPFWQQGWFIALWLMAVLSVVYFYFKWQIRIIQKRNQLLAEKVELEQNLNTSMLTSIKAQMNPHFFYNALNTIQSFIFSNEKENASAYLNKFSKLTRVILEMSEKESVTLAEEINAITLYLEIEKARFNDDFNYTIFVDKNLETEVMRIPSMILQPYIENSIKHGLMHKKGEKKLDIKFEVDLENLTISIDDNGVGRKVSEELNKKKLNRHKPFATKANQKRIDLLNQGNSVIGVEYIDNENPSGTMVKIVLPLHKSKNKQTAA